MESQNSDKIIRRCLNSAMSQIRQIVSPDGQFNRTVKINKAKLLKDQRKSFNSSKGLLHLPQINPLAAKNKSSSLYDKQKEHQVKKIDPQENNQCLSMKNRKQKFNMHKTIFSYLQNPTLQPKLTKKKKNSSSKNSAQSKSDSRNLSNCNKLEPSKNYTKNLQLPTPRKFKIPIQKGLQSNSNIKLQQKTFNAQSSLSKELHSQLSAKQILLNVQIQTKDNFKISKISRYQDSTLSFDRKTLQSPQKNLSRVESGFQIIRQNKMKMAAQMITQGKIDKATEIFNLLLQIDENDVQVMYQLAKLSEQQSQQQLSKKYLRLIILNQANSFKFDQQILKVKALYKLQKYSQAVQKIENIENQTLIILSPEEKVQLFKIKGQLYFKRQFLQDALQCFQETLSIIDSEKLEKPKAGIHLYIGKIYFQYRLYKKAQKHFEFYLNLSVNQPQKLQQNVFQKIKICQRSKSKKYSQNQIFKNKNQKIPQLKKSFQVSQSLSSKNNIQEENQKQAHLNAYKIFITNHKGKCQNLKQMKYHSQKTIHFAENLKKIGQQKDDTIFQNMNQSSSLLKIQENAKLHYKMGDMEKCFDEFERYINFSTLLKQSNVSSKLHTKSIKSSKNFEEISEGLNFYLLKIKQLQMNEMIEENHSQITKRRNYNISQAIKQFDSYSLQGSLDQVSQIRALSVIGEQSTTSVIKNSSVFGQSTSVVNDIFSLKQFREVFKKWNVCNFSLESLDQIVSATYDLVKNDKSDFSILPLHIIIYTMKMMKEKQSFGQINKNIQQKFIDLCKKYPPSQKSITQSELRSFQINFSNKQKIDLFKGNSLPQNFKEIYKRVQQLSRKASSEKQIMDEICKQICQENNGFSYKSNLKLPVSTNSHQKDKNQKIYCRIIQKILSKELKDKKQIFFESIEFKQQMKVKNLFLEMSQRWQETIDEILKQKIIKKQKTNCYVYDLMRAKSMFQSIKDIDATTEAFIEGEKKGQYQIIQIDNRLNNKTKDVVLKIQFKEIVGELQLALQFQSQKNEFNHSLYELSRSPFGSFFASFMWLTGFATSNESSKLVFNEKMKWEMKRLQHLKKFIYEQKLIISFGNQSIEQIVKKQFQSEFLYLQDFVMKTKSIEGYLRTQNGEYIDINLREQNPKSSRILVESIVGSKISLDFTQTNNIFQLCLTESKPSQKFRFLFSQSRQSFASQQNQKQMMIHLNGTNYFITLNKKGQLQERLVLKEQVNIQNGNQSGSQILNLQNPKVFKINFIGEKQKKNIQANENEFHEQDYSEQIKQIISIQKSLNDLVRNNFSF